MGFSEHKFLQLPYKSRAKKLADRLRVFLLRLGTDWKLAAVQYDQLVRWHLGNQIREEHLLTGNVQHGRVLDLYLHWREEAGLGAERDVYLQQNPGDLLEATCPPLPWNVLAHNLRSAYNVGSVLRSIDCFGWAELHLSGYTPSIEHTALRSAARGAESWVPSHRWSSPLDCIQFHREQGYELVALETGPQATRISHFSWPKKGLVLLGNEELGLAPELLALCQHHVEIPMYGRKASLNVAAAFAVLASRLRD